MSNDELRARLAYRIWFVVEVVATLLGTLYLPLTHPLVILVLLPTYISLIRERVKIINSTHLVEPINRSPLELKDETKKSQFTVVVHVYQGQVCNCRDHKADT